MGKCKHEAWEETGRIIRARRQMVTRTCADCGDQLKPIPIPYDPHVDRTRRSGHR